MSGVLISVNEKDTGLPNLLKIDFCKVVFCEFCNFLKNAYFARHSRVAAPKIL